MSSYPTFNTKYMLIPDPKVVKSPRVLAAGEIALHIKKSSAKKEYMVTKTFTVLDYFFNGAYRPGISTG